MWLRTLMILMITLFTCVSGFTEEITPDDVLRIYDAQSQQDRELFEKLILEDIKNDLLSINQAGTILRKRAAFEQLYRELSSELANQSKAPFAQYSEITKMRRSTERLILHAISNNDDSIFKGIADDVYDDLFADSDEPLDGFRQLTYEPLLREVNGVVLAAPIAIMAVAVVARLLPTGQRGRALLVGGAAILGIISLTGCEVLEWIDDNSDAILGIVLQIIRLWAAVETNQVDFQESLEDTVDEFHALIVELEDIASEFTESVKRQLYSALFVTIVDFMLKYMTDEAVQAAENQRYREANGMEEDDGASTPLNEDSLTGDDDEEFFDSIQVQVIWAKFIEAVNLYVIHEGLRDAILQAAEDTKRAILGFIYNVYKEYEIVFNVIEYIVQQIKSLTERRGEPFDESNREYRRDWIALDTYIAGLMAWIEEAEQAGDEGEEGPDGSSSTENDKSDLPFRILTPEEREQLERAGLPPTELTEQERAAAQEGR